MASFIQEAMPLRPGRKKNRVLDSFHERQNVSRDVEALHRKDNKSAKGKPVRLRPRQPYLRALKAELLFSHPSRCRRPRDFLGCHASRAINEYGSSGGEDGRLFSDAQ